MKIPHGLSTNIVVAADKAKETLSIFPEILSSLDLISIHLGQNGKTERRQDGKEAIAILPFCRLTVLPLCPLTQSPGLS